MRLKIIKSFSPSLKEKIETKEKNEPEKRAMQQSEALIPFVHSLDYCVADSLTKISIIIEDLLTMKKRLSMKVILPGYLPHHPIFSQEREEKSKEIKIYPFGVSTQYFPLLDALETRKITLKMEALDDQTSTFTNVNAILQWSDETGNHIIVVNEDSEIQKIYEHELPLILNYTHDFD